MQIKNIENGLSLIELSNNLKNNFCIIKSKQQKNKKYTLPCTLKNKLFFITKGLFFKYNIFNRWGVKFPILALFEKEFKVFKKSLNSLNELDNIIIIKLKNLSFRYYLSYKILTFFENISIFFFFTKSFIYKLLYFFNRKTYRKRIRRPHQTQV